jgi:hypothetical protein
MRRFILPFWLLAASLLVTAADAQNVYFGNLHSHTSYSDGVGTPDDAFRHARNVAKIDFLAITEHNHIRAESGAGDREDGILIATRPELYNGTGPEALIPTAARWTEDGKFIALYGQEYSTISSGNHVNVFDVPRVITVPNGEYKQLLAWLDSNRDTNGGIPLIQFNHPGLFNNPGKEYGRHKFSSTEEWIRSLDPNVKLIEVLNGPGLNRGSEFRSEVVQEDDYFRYLNLGFHLAPSTGQDNHYDNWGSLTDARVAVLADSLTKQNILQALKNRRAYATEDKNLRIIFRVNGHLMGDIVPTLPEAGSKLEIEVSLKDDDEPDAHYRIEVYSDVPGGDPARTPVKVVEIEGDTVAPVKIEGVRYERPGQYVFLKIIQTPEHGQQDRAWTAPVWFDGPVAVPPTATDTIRIVELLPNPSGRDEENESVTLKNVGTDPVSLNAWLLRDLSGAMWTLNAAGILNGGQEKTVKRNFQPMSLNNEGDTVQLLNPAGRVVQTVSFGPVGVNEIVRP